MSLRSMVIRSLSVSFAGVLIAACGTGEIEDGGVQLRGGSAGAGGRSGSTARNSGAKSTSSDTTGGGAGGNPAATTSSGSESGRSSGSSTGTGSERSGAGGNSTSRGSAGNNTTSGTGNGASSNGNSSTNRGTGGTNAGSAGNNTSTASSGGNGGTERAGAAGAGGAAAVFVVPEDAKPTPETSGTNGAFRVNTKTGRLTHDGAEFQVRGGNWFGLEGQDDIARPGAMELYIGSVFWADKSNMRTIEKTMQEIKAAPLSFNTIRLPIAPQTLVKGHKDGLYSRSDAKIRNNDPTAYPYEDAYEALEDFIKQADKNGVYVILDMHSCSNHIGWRAGKIDDGPPWTDANRENYKYKKEDYFCNKGEDAYDVDKWLADIHTLAKLPKKLGVKNIIGVDCFNEPFKYSWSQWPDLAKQCYDAIAAEDDDLIAIVEGVSSSHVDTNGESVPEPFGDAPANPNWGENLYGQQFDPIQIPKDRLCFSPHTYGPAVFVQKQFVDQSDPACVGLEDDAAGKAKCKLVVERTNTEAAANIRKGWDEHFGYLADQKYCVIIGEFGGYKDWPSNPVKPQAATIWAHLPTSVRYDWEWQNMLVAYLNDKRITDFTYWSINPESGDTGGIYNHAYSLSNESGWGVWQGLDTEKVSLLAGLK